MVAATVAVATLGVAAWLGGLVPFGRTGTMAAKGPDLVLVASFENPTGDRRKIARAIRGLCAESETLTGTLRSLSLEP